MRVTAAGTGTLIDEVERLLEKAVRRKSRYVRLADRAARFYAPVVHVTAALTAVGWLIAGASLHDAIVIAIAVLIITCPCAIALAIPTVQVVASGALFRVGRDSQRRRRHRTPGRSRHGGVRQDRNADAAGAARRQRRCHRLRTCWSAPRGWRCRAAIRSRGGRARGARSHAVSMAPSKSPGRACRATIDGSEARLGSPAFCGISSPTRNVERTPRRSSAFATPAARPSSPFVRRCVPMPLRSSRSSRRAGFDLTILSGDREEAVAPVAAALGISPAFAGLKPAEKIASIERLNGQGRRTLMVGDGINDAPALAAAHVSLSPISAAHITQAHADAVFLGRTVASRSVDAIAIARRARTLMRQNLWLAVLYNAIAVPIAIAGHVTPLIAAAGDVRFIDPGHAECACASVRSGRRRAAAARGCSAGTFTPAAARPS